MEKDPVASFEALALKRAVSNRLFRVGVALPYKKDVGVRPRYSMRGGGVGEANNYKEGSLDEKWDFTQERGLFGDKL